MCVGLSSSNKIEQGQVDSTKKISTCEPIKLWFSKNSTQPKQKLLIKQGGDLW